MLRTITLTLLILVVPAAAHAEKKLKVVTTFSILGDIVSNIGGDKIEVTTLVGPNADAHEYEPTPEAVKRVGDADIVIANGLGFEGWIGRLIVSSGYSGPVVIAAKNITAMNAGEKLETDPHAWQSVTNVINYTAAIRDGLIEADPAHSAQYKNNTENYLKELNSLESWINAQINTIPKEQRSVISNHDAFQYYGRYYGIHFIAPTNVSNSESPSAASVAHIVDVIRRDKIRAVFLENFGDDKIIRQLEQDAGAYAGGVLFPDALSTPAGPASTYVNMMKHNTKLLVDGMKHNGANVAPNEPTESPNDSIVISIP